VEFIVYEFWGRCRNRNNSAETEKIGAETAKIQSAEKSAETGILTRLLYSKLKLELKVIRRRIILGQLVGCFSTALSQGIAG
jgi:hypothetical protein